MTVDLSPRPLSFGSLGFFSRLFREYCDGFEPFSQYFTHDYRTPEGRRAAADLAARHPRDREQLVSVLREQNAAWGVDETASGNIERLLDPESVTVVTGQQVGLFGGPLYTIYKTITLLHAARSLQSDTGRPVIPVFWLEGEDHDFDEISSVSVFSRNEPSRLTYSGHRMPADGNLGPVGRLALDAQIEDVERSLDDALPPTDFKAEVMALVRASYRPGTTLLDAFARFMARLFTGTGLVFVSPSDARLKALVSPLFARDLQDPDALPGAMAAVTDRLRQAYHAQVSVRASNLFLIDENGRHSIETVDGGFTVRGGNGVVSRHAMLETLASTPGSFSANVVMRPLMQDALLPTAAYVAGPSELAYFAQFKPAYDWAGIPMPAIIPRASATIVERKVQKVLDEYQIGVADLDGDLDALFQRILRDRLDVDVDARFEGANVHVHDSINLLKPFLEEVDRTLVKSAEATRAAMLKELDRLRQRALKSEKRKHEEVRERLEKARTNLFPYGKPQERSISVIYFLNKYGLDFIRSLHDGLSPQTGHHEILAV